MRLFGKNIPTMTPETLKSLCENWKAFAKEPMKYKDTLVEKMVVQWLLENTK